MARFGLVMQLLLLSFQPKIRLTIWSLCYAMLWWCISILGGVRRGGSATKIATACILFNQQYKSSLVKGCKAKTFMFWISKAFFFSVGCFLW